MKAIGYCRVSSTEQVEGTSLQTQRSQIGAYSALKGLELVEIFEDGGVSGGTPIAARPQGSKLVEALNSGVADAVIIIKLDRAFRSALDCLQTIEEWQNTGIALHIVDLGGTSIDTSSTMGRFMLTVLAASAEMERGMIKDRCNAGRRARKLAGQRIGEIPYGFDLSQDRKGLTANSREQETLQEIQRLRHQGRTLREIADELNRNGYTSKKGRQWTHGTVANVLRRAA